MAAQLVGSICCRQARARMAHCPPKPWVLTSLLTTTPHTAGTNAETLTHYLRAFSLLDGAEICTDALGLGGSGRPYNVKGLSDTTPTPSGNLVVLWPPLRAPERALASASLALLMVDATASGDELPAAAAAASARAARIASSAPVLLLLAEVCLGLLFAGVGCPDCDLLSPEACWLLPLADVLMELGLDGRVEVICFLLLPLLSLPAALAGWAALGASAGA